MSHSTTPNGHSQHLPSPEFENDLVTIEFILAQAQMMKALLALVADGGVLVYMPSIGATDLDTALSQTAKTLLSSVCQLMGIEPIVTNVDPRS